MPTHFGPPPAPGPEHCHDIQPHTQAADTGTSPGGRSNTPTLTRHGAGALVMWPWGVADLCLSIVALVAVGAIFPGNVQIGSWLVWAPGYAFGTAVGLGVWAGSLRRAALLSFLIASVYLAEMLVWSGLDVWTIAGNALQYPLAATASPDRSRKATSRRSVGSSQHPSTGSMTCPSRSSPSSAATLGWPRRRHSH
ncbi:MAG: hypothetical protein JWN00_5624 [Actinomycetia bacterium]|nr:hypothetical protein [Actinomycetes bacterium]